MATDIELFVDSDNRAKITGLHDPAYAVGHASYYVNDAVVSLSVYPAVGKPPEAGPTPLAGATNVSLPYLAASDGNYAGYFPSTVVLVYRATYFAKVTIVRAGRTTTIRQECVAKYYAGDS